MAKRLSPVLKVSLPFAEALGPPQLLRAASPLFLSSGIVPNEAGPRLL